MFVALWEYEVKPGCEESFQSAYGPRGDWGPALRTRIRTTARLVSSMTSPVHASYFTLDYWDSEISFEQFKSRNQAATPPLIKPPNLSQYANAASPRSSNPNSGRLQVVPRENRSGAHPGGQC